MGEGGGKQAHGDYATFSALSPGTKPNETPPLLVGLLTSREQRDKAAQLFLASYPVRRQRPTTMSTSDAKPKKRRGNWRLKNNICLLYMEARWAIYGKEMGNDSNTL